MAEEAALSICKFSESQKEEFRKLDEQMKKKWNIQLRWDSKVPENDKWLFYFFTLRGLNTEQISNTIKKLENEFDAINEDMKKIREGRDLSQERIEGIRQRFEKVLGEMQMLNKSTDSSSLYTATSDALAKKEDVLRCFDHVEIVQSRRELPDKKRQLDDLKRLNENKDETILTISKVYDDYVQKDLKNEETIDILENQLRVSQENSDEYKDLTNELMHKINPMLFDCNMATEEGNDIHTVIEINMLVMDRVFDMFNSFEDSKDKEWKCEEKLINFENKLTIHSLETLQRMLKLKQLVEKMISDSSDGGKTDSKEKKLAFQESKTDHVSIDEFDVSDIRQKRNEEWKVYLKYHLKVVLERNKEFREESEELMKLMNSMLPDTSDLKKTEVPVLQTVVEINEFMKNKLNTVHKLFEDFNKREWKRNDKIENLAKTIRTKFEQILGEIHKIMELLNMLQRRDPKN